MDSKIESQQLWNSCPVGTSFYRPRCWRPLSAAVVSSFSIASPYGRPLERMPYEGCCGRYYGLLGELNQTVCPQRYDDAKTSPDPPAPAGRDGLAFVSANPQLPTRPYTSRVSAWWMEASPKLESADRVSFPIRQSGRTLLLTDMMILIENVGAYMWSQV